MFGADLRTPFHHQRGGQPLLTEAPKRRPGPITASRRVKLLVWAVPVAPAVGEPPSEPGTRDLPAQLAFGLQPTSRCRWSAYAPPRASQPTCVPCSERVVVAASFIRKTSLRRQPNLLAQALVQRRPLALAADLDEIARGIVGHAGANQDHLAEKTITSPRLKVPGCMARLLSHIA
jgi:hypothetical protein